MASSGDQIWVATEVYTPGMDQSDTFNLVPGVVLYGGFAGTHGTEGDFSAQDWVANPTIRVSVNWDGLGANLKFSAYLRTRRIRNEETI